MPLSADVSDVTSRRGADEHALSAVTKATADPSTASLDQCVCMGRTLLSRVFRQAALGSFTQRG